MSLHHVLALRLILKVENLFLTPLRCVDGVVNLYNNPNPTNYVIDEQPDDEAGLENVGCFRG